MSCKKECSHCCYGQVSISKDESYLLAQRVRDGVHIDNFRLHIQSKVESNSEWLKLPYQMRRCTFLNESNLCSVYEDRPAVCRTNYTFNLPHQCSTEDGVEKKLRLLKTNEADMIIIGAYFYSGENGYMSKMLADKLTLA